MKYYENELNYPSNNNTQLSEENFNNYKIVLETLNNGILDREIEPFPEDLLNSVYLCLSIR
jgi:hypothetical protein